MRYAKYLALAAGMAGCTGAEADSAVAAGFGEGGPPPTPVDVAEARQDTVIDEILATGQIEAVQAIQLRPEVEGRLVELMVREGSEVREGTPLFRIDDSELRAQVARLRAERDLAQQALERTRDLISRNASYRADLEQAEASFRSAEAQLELQQIRLDRTVVRAPFGGVVGQRFVSLGDYVTNGTRLATLQTVDPQRVAFAVPERYAQRLANGQEVAFRVAAVTGREYTGAVEFVDPVVELPARTITVKARVRNRDRTLKSGDGAAARHRQAAR
jgi:membrane fusion protein (multidrug efflux system)